MLLGYGIMAEVFLSIPKIGLLLWLIVQAATPTLLMGLKSII